MEDLKTQLEKVISDLGDIQARLDMFSNSNTLPRDIENTLRERLNISQLVVSSGVTGSASTQNVILTGNPQTITVPAQPTGTVSTTVVVGGVATTFNLLYQ